MMPPRRSYGVQLDVAAVIQRRMAVADVAVGRLVGLPPAVEESAVEVVEEAAEATTRRLELGWRHHRKLAFLLHCVFMFIAYFSPS
jgi:hypothetical protein